MTLIRAYGEFWRKEGLNRRQRENRDQGRLPGRIRSGGTKVDVWKQRGIYVLQLDYKPVYVGQAADRSLGSRLRDHLGDRHAGRWDTFSWYGVLDFKKKGAHGLLEPAGFRRRGISQEILINTLEAVAIAIADPPLNRARTRIPGAVYVEQADIGAGLTMEGQVREIYNFVRGQEEKDAKARKKSSRHHSRRRGRR